MDTLHQTKLSLAEWKSIEEPITPNEKRILQLIRDGYQDVNKRTNNTSTIISITKLEQNPEIDFYLYDKFLKPEIKIMIEKYGRNIKELENFQIKENTLKKIKSIDLLRIKHVETNITENKTKMFEYLLLDFCRQVIKSIHKKENSHTFYLYTLIQLKKNQIQHVNQNMVYFWDLVIRIGKQNTNLKSVLKNADEFIERNRYLLQYEDLSLFSHQKELFSSCHRNKDIPKLILYTAPTGTGKTLSPIGLSEGYRILFVCVARHVGLSLAKSAISLEKKVAFAFGCETASDIRLHYYSAVDYTINKRSGGIGKVDNSNGRNVEIMICDAQSYLTAMYYMLSFNAPDQLLTYWDEPTITMDYIDHPLHEVIQRNWQENRIPNMILSCATLPKEEEIPETISSFRCKFTGAEIHTITSYDCKKSIPILNKDGYCVLPHLLYNNIKCLKDCALFCEKNKTLLRYFDLSEILRFIEYISTDHLSDNLQINNYFSDISEITMNSLKIYYLEILKYISISKNEDWENEWMKIHNHLKITQERKFSTNMLMKTQSFQELRLLDKDKDTKTKKTTLTKTKSEHIFQSSPVLVKPHIVPEGAQGILLTTVDAYTLTDGPTIFLAEEMEMISNFYIKMSKIPEGTLQTISQTIIENDKILREIDELDTMMEKKLQVKDNSDKDNGASSSKNEKKTWDSETENLMDKITLLRKKIRFVSMDPQYIPNTIPHQKQWTPTREIYPNAFMPTIEEETVREIMSLDIDRSFKILVLLGIGVLIKQKNQQYEEIVKRLADEQRMLLILASSDYIYGTNYQFCHGMIGKDLKNMTPQKTLQAMGRIGRNNIQQEYTVRFRSDDMIYGLFTTPIINLESVNMEKLFCL
jgi:hypothetical protein